ncbi:hypothetical protein OsJ_28363 [Oryza sativa Japonica Group]|uniref:Uncharacterized protein n=1 Tax=Oryza sativa subsp. japonica TaxID=39947 RepID=B9G238_ORYSJ|nr:hypothetical protein OsJ_28363 [Oryza sativa Japonica Group]
MEMAAGMEVAARLTMTGGSGGEAGDGGRIQALQADLAPPHGDGVGAAVLEVAAVLRRLLLASVAGGGGSSDGSRLAATVPEEAAATSALKAGKESDVR